MGIHGFSLASSYCEMLSYLKNNTVSKEKNSKANQFQRKFKS